MFHGVRVLLICYYTPYNCNVMNYLHISLSRDENFNTLCKECKQTFRFCMLIIFLSVNCVFIIGMKVCDNLCKKGRTKI